MRSQTYAGCSRDRMSSPLWTAFWRGSATCSNWSHPGRKVCQRTTVKESPPPPPPLLLLPRTHLATAPRQPPPAPPPRVTPTWRRSIRRRRGSEAPRRRRDHSGSGEQVTDRSNSSRGSFPRGVGGGGKEENRHI